MLTDDHRCVHKYYFKQSYIYDNWYVTQLREEVGDWEDPGTLPTQNHYAVGYVLVDLKCYFHF
mgnify:CR=1 FL=1